MESDLQQWFDQLASILSIAPKGPWIAIWALPIVLALFSRGAAIVLGSVLAVAVSLLVVLEPQSAFIVVAIGAYLSALLLAAIGIHVRRNATHAKLEMKVEMIESRLENLRQANERAFFIELRGKEDAPELPLFDLPKDQSPLAPELPAANQ